MCVRHPKSFVPSAPSSSPRVAPRCRSRRFAVQSARRVSPPQRKSLGRHGVASKVRMAKGEHADRHTIRGHVFPPISSLSLRKKKITRLIFFRFLSNCTCEYCLARCYIYTVNIIIFYYTRIKLNELRIFRSHVLVLYIKLKMAQRYHTGREERFRFLLKTKKPRRFFVDASRTTIILIASFAVTKIRIVFYLRLYDIRITNCRTQ